MLSITLKRIKNEWIFQYHIIRLAVDWTVFLYIFIPFFIYVGFQYYVWWTTEDIFSINLSYWQTSIGLYILCWTGRIRSFIQEADQLFLIPKKKLMNSLKKHGLIYSFAINLLFCLLVWAALLPFLVKVYHWSNQTILLTLLFTVLLRFMVSCIKKYVFLIILKRWLLFVISGLIFLSFAALHAIAFNLLLYSNAIGFSMLLLQIIAMLFFGAVMIRFQSGRFFRESEYEQQQKMRLISYLFNKTGIIENKSLMKRKLPFVFKESNIIFANRSTVNILVETRFKAFLRNTTNLKILSQYLIFGAVAIWIVPFWMRWIVWGVLTLGMVFWMNGYYKESLQVSFMRLFTWTFMDKMSARRKAIILLSLPSLLLLFVVLLAPMH